MTLSITSRADASSYTISQLPASSFCSKISELILKVVAAIRNFFELILSSCFKNQKNPTLSTIDHDANQNLPTEKKPLVKEPCLSAKFREDHNAIINQPENFDVQVEEPPLAEVLPLSPKSTKDHNATLNLPEDFDSTTSEPQKSTSSLSKFISKNGNQILSKVTGVKIKYVDSAAKFLVGSADALRNGKYKIAAAAGVSSLSAMIVAGTNLFIPKEVRELNKLTTHTDPNTEQY